MVVGGYDNLEGMAALTTTIEVTPGTNETVQIVRSGAIEAFFARGRDIGVAGTTGMDVPECQGCVYQMLCGGGCRASAFKVAGHMTAHNTLMCRHLKTGAQSQLRRYAAHRRGQRQLETA